MDCKNKQRQRIYIKTKDTHIDLRYISKLGTYMRIIRTDKGVKILKRNIKILINRDILKKYNLL